MFGLFSKKRKTSIKAVQESDLIDYLKSLGVLKQVKSGECRCKSCKGPISLENLEAIIPHEGHIYFICSNKECVSKI